MATATPRIRPGAAVGRFYDAEPTRCAEEARRLCRPLPDMGLPAIVWGAVVPHAGWICSGRVAGRTLATVAGHTSARTFVLAGAAHYYPLTGPVTDRAEAWMTPLGPVEVDGELRDAITGLEGFACIDEVHRPEHSLEVQLPLMQTALGADVRIVPCLVPSRPDAPLWGERLGELLMSWPEPVVTIASSDLTHYGPEFGFTPAGSGAEAEAWVHDVNDRVILDLIERMAADEIVPIALERCGACGGGAIAATVAACRRLGATRGYVLEHTDSARELGLGPSGRAAMTSFVGYAGVVMG